MYKKTIFSGLVILLLVGANASASVYWDGEGGGDRSWANPVNWVGDAVPSIVLLDSVKLYYVSGPADGPLVNTSDANAFKVRIGGPAGGATWCTLSVAGGGVLTLGEWLMAGTDSGSIRSGELNMTGGTINLGTVNVMNGHFFVSHSGGTITNFVQGFVNMSGGTINATGTFAVAFGAYTSGTVNLSGGTIYSDSFQMNPSGLGTASMDITGTGKLIIDGDETAAIIGYIGNGWLTGYGNEDDVVYDYNDTNPDKTTVTATPPAWVDIDWTDANSDGDWNIAANWSPAQIPNSTSERAIIPIAAGPVFSVGRTATAWRVLMQGTNGTITMDGGTLTTNDYLDIGYGASDSGTLTVNSGTIDVNTVAYCGRAGTATLNMSGGAINIASTFYVARDSTSTGNVNLSGGTINCSALFIGLNGGSGLINITASGTLIIDGDATATVNNYVTGGKIKSYSGAGTVLFDYNITTTGKTTVTASPPTKAGAPSPANFANNVSTLTDLSWVGMIEALSHDVYFDTTSPPAFIQNQPETTFDPCVLNPNTTYYWRINEVTGSNTVIGDIWMFTTGSVIATLPSPVDGASNVSVNAILSWTAGVTASSHDVYFGTDPTPDVTEFMGNQTSTTFDPSLTIDTTYYWCIDEVEDINNVYAGDVWSFTTQGSFEKGPYLIYPGNNTEMTVLWQMTTVSSCTLEWGLNTSYLSGSTITSEYGDHQHQHTITGLTPGTKYYYRVTAGVAQSTGSFRTAPATDATSVKFLVYGDTRTNPGDHNTVSAGMISTFTSDPDFQTVLLHSGDWVNTDSENDWTNEFFNRSYPAALQMQASLPIQGCMGNHEGAGSVYTKYWPYPYVTSRYWSFDYGPAHIAIVDQYAMNPAQLTWLGNDLSASTKQWKFIVLHEPGWTAGGSHGNNTDVQNDIQPLCELYGVQIVFGGHNHYYSRADVNDVHHITTGGGGAPLYNPVAGEPYIVTYNKTLHYCKVAIDGNSLSLQAIKPDGTVIDLFYIDKEDPDFTFVQAADPQMTFCPNSPSNWQVTTSKVNAVNPAFLIVTGDLLNNPGSQPEADMYFAAAAGLKPGITRYDLAGNHDVHDAPTPSSYAWYQSRFVDPCDPCAPPWYSFTYGNNLFIALESCILKNATGYPGKDVNEIDWLTTTLSGAGGYDNVLVFMHHPLCVSSVSEPNAWNNMPLARRSQLASDSVRHVWRKSRICRTLSPECVCICI
jgi:hypothetical protein